MADAGTAPMTAGPVLTYLMVGPERHGVVRHGLALAAELHRVADVEIVHLPDAAGLQRRAAGPVHLEVTDALFGATPAEALARITGSLCGRMTTLTLHDVPQPAEGGARFTRRAAAYAELTRWAAGVVVSSHHELALVHALGGVAELRSGPDGAVHRKSDRTPIAVIPLPVEDRRTPTTTSPEPEDEPLPLPAELAGMEQDVVLLGFLYPGKGHEQALRALADLRAPAVGGTAGATAARHATATEPARTGVGLPDRVTALGAVADGHEELLGQLEELATSLGLRFWVTGFAPDDLLDAALRTAGIPVAAHRNVSASGSLASWASVGRRAIVPASRYTREMEQLRPGTLDLVEAGSGLDSGKGRRDGHINDPTATVRALAAGIARAVDEPGRTHLAPGVELGPSLRQCAVRLLEFNQRVVA